MPPPPRPRLVLASASPSRLTMLRTAGFDPEVIPSRVDEDGVGGLSPADTVRTLAERKAGAVADRLAAESVTDTARLTPPSMAGSRDAVPRAVVLGCDSLLAIDGQIRGKPATIDEARTWWLDQRGKLGTLVTGHCVVTVPAGRRAANVAQTHVRFGEPTDAEVEAYLATGEPLHVAGAATIDGYGAPFVDRIDGDHGTVLGLSLPLLRRLLADLGIAITDLWGRP
ncbi:MAG: Maf family protein [Acidimicrobiales bacterium]